MSIPEYPLQWPDAVPRTAQRVQSQFKTTLHQALANVDKALRAFAKDSGKQVTGIVLSSNVGGLSLKTPVDPGVAAWFTWDGEQRCIAVDRYPKPADNLQAIYHIIEARRTEMRHGGLHVVRQTFKGFTALPAPDDPWKLLGLAPGASADAIDKAYRERAKSAHPDAGGSADAMARLSWARDTAKGAS
ncbi:DnaJ domain-containing protein [Sphingomonas sp. SFZ2018-12]|uniref:J domain-containing protein n=1 Tax=Sphingomonas sp. SFZ2018-12 TaxID=2683197 RepID=UPI001F10CD87|nr:J domain-containing protein [Sphingomonas sp. SFZ2018-12]MCH4893970.1 DnaJ domain-containing protein [Sphingomonas sp. SFZ2018-12]